MVRVHSLPKVEDRDGLTLASVLGKATVAIHLLRHDPKVKYMVGWNAAFGFSGAFINGFVNGRVVPVALGDASWVGVLVAVHGTVAALASLLFATLSVVIGKGPILVLGAFSFACVALAFVIQPNFLQWTFPWLLVIYSIHGIGRAVFEGTLKAIFADMFEAEREGAFANIILQYGVASSVAYVLSLRLSCSAKSTYCVEYQDGSLHNVFAFECIIIGTSVIAILGYWRASFLFVREQQQQLQTYPSSTYSRRQHYQWVDRDEFAGCGERGTSG
jgi:MFS family permease